ncbi:MAG: hypothetical protein ABI723_16025 [Bacteroidia bacterium]
MKKIRNIFFWKILNTTSQRCLILIILFTLQSCTKEKVTSYEVNPVTVKQDGSAKQHVKTTLEFISIAYSDLYGTAITSDVLQKLNIAYSSFGDKKLIEDMIIRNFLNSPSIKIPTKAQMKNDVPKFVTDTYKKLYNRTPNEFENYFITKMINNDITITPELVYYSMMTSNEYRYY